MVQHEQMCLTVHHIFLVWGGLYHLGFKGKHFNMEKQGKLTAKERGFTSAPITSTQINPVFFPLGQLSSLLVRKAPGMLSASLELRQGVSRYTPLIPRLPKGPAWSRQRGAGHAVTAHWYMKKNVHFTKEWSEQSSAWLIYVLKREIHVSHLWQLTSETETHPGTPLYLPSATWRGAF